MTINDMELDKVLWCDKCGYTSIVPDKMNCPICNEPLEEIGFVEDKSKRIVGGRLTPGICKCGNPLASKGLDDQGRRRYRTSCGKCRYQASKHKKSNCNHCGISVEIAGQLDIDHIDGDRSNNNISNLQTLCKICHKNKTRTQQDWKRK